MAHRSARSIAVVVLAVGSCAVPATLSAQTVYTFAPPAGAVSFGASVSSGLALSTSPGIAVGAEHRVGTDRRGREVRLRVQGGIDRLRVESLGEFGAGYLARRHVAVGFSRYTDDGPRGGIDPYVFAQAGRQRFFERDGQARARSVGLGIGVDVAPIGSLRAMTIEYGLTLVGQAALPSGRHLGGMATRRLQVGYKRRF
jgi:hypothetical protein